MSRHCPLGEAFAKVRAEFLAL
ncbi:hypothetical protein OF001_U370017 [Pseudomonas sp. OF001]|nr:hypothetical protein OF001_U370017 [Pseudomonas sp. OF001]